jgi:hypothetical protein
VSKIKKTVFFGILVLFLITNILPSRFTIEQVRASQNNMEEYPLAFQYETQPSTITIMSPQNLTYTVNASIPLTFTTEQFPSWIGYSLNGQTNATIAGNTTLPTLPDGWQYVVVYANDTFGNMQASQIKHFTVDTVAPTGSIKINGGATSTILPSVMLTLSAQDATSGVIQMRFFDAAWLDWEEYTTSRPWMFTAGDEYKTVYVQFKDNAGLVSDHYRATIILGNNLPPDPIVVQVPPAETPEETNPQPTETVDKDQVEKTPEATSVIPTSTLPPKSITNTYFMLEIIGIIAIAIVGAVVVLMALKTAINTHKSPKKKKGKSGNVTKLGI